MPEETPYLTAMPTTLMWPDTDPHPAEVLHRWTAFAYGCLAMRLDAYAADAPARAAALSGALACLAPAERDAVVLAPAVTALTLPGRSRHPGHWADALQSVLESPPAPDPDRDPVRSPDLDSAAALAVDLTGRDLTVPARRPMSGSRRRVTLARMRDASGLLDRIGGPLPWFVRTFTLALVVQADDEDERFSSGSHGYFVGRTVLANVHRDGLGTPDVVDALVHEAIHALLYMQEDMEPWLLDPGLLEQGPTIESPWTGNPLPLRPYLQACFVWYGLTHLWARASGSAPDDSSRRLLVRAARGFTRGSLTQRVAAHADGLQPALLVALEEMQDRVCAAMAGAA